MTKNWIAVASADHAKRAGSFMQVCHGKAAPLKRVAPGDRVAYYAPTVTFRGKDKCQAFVRFGVVRDGLPYQADMREGFCPYRRDVDWLETRDAPIAPLLAKLEFTAGGRNWGYQLRFGLLAVSDHDMGLIAKAMGADLP